MDRTKYSDTPSSSASCGSVRSFISFSFWMPCGLPCSHNQCNVLLPLFRSDTRGNPARAADCGRCDNPSQPGLRSVSMCQGLAVWSSSIGLLFVSSFDSSGHSLKSAFLKPHLSLLQLGESQRVFSASKRTFLESFQPVDADSDDCFLCDSVDSTIRDWTILEGQIDWSVRDCVGIGGITSRP
jgi:hypothetical protein